MKKSAIYACCFLILLAFVVGCGKRKPIHESNRGPVKGSLSLDGKPLPGGKIGFVSIKDPTYTVSAMIKTDGTFFVDDAPTGEVKVSVTTEPARIGNASGYFPIPEKYWDAETSGLTATIKPEESDETVLTFDLKSQ